MPIGEKDFNSTASFKGGAAFEYIDLTEADFTDTAGSAYTPPETGVLRRINVARTLQILKNAPSNLTSSQTSEAYIHLPCGNPATNDALDGRIFYFKNNGTEDIIIKNYQGNDLATITPTTPVIIRHKDNDDWDFFFTSDVPINKIISSSFILGKTGVVNVSGTSLINETVPSNKTGILVPADGELAKLTLNVETAATTSYGVYRKVGAVETLLAFISLAGTKKFTKPITGVPLTEGDELVVSLISGSAKNIKLDVTIIGKLT